MCPRNAVLLAVAAALLAGAAARAADHREAPAVNLDTRADISDVYVFQSPAALNRTVLILTATLGSGSDGASQFNPAEYTVNVDNNFDEKPDVTLSWRIGGATEGGVQPYEFRINRPARGGQGESIRRRGRVGGEVMLPGDARAYAALTDDPFFFDLPAFIGETTGEGERRFCDGQETDSFAGTNVAAMVAELPSQILVGESSSIQVWASARTASAIDRMGLPAVNVLYLPEGDKDAFNATKPRQHDHRWSDVVEETLLLMSAMGPSPYDPAEAAAIASVLLPDVLTFDTRSGAGFVRSFNGRRVDEDVMDRQLAILTGGFFGDKPALETDCVDRNDVPLPTSFPYLAAPHQQQGR